MSRYDFTPERVGNSPWQAIAGATADVLDKERQRRRENQQQANVDRSFNQGVKESDRNYDLNVQGERRMQGATDRDAIRQGFTLGDQPNDSSSIPIPAAVDDGDQDVDPPIGDFGYHPEGEEAGAIPMPTFATTSGAPVRSGGGDAPTAGEVHFNGGSYNYQRSEGARALAFSDALQRESESRIHARNRGETLQDRGYQETVDTRENQQGIDMENLRSKNDLSRGISLENLRSRNQINERNAPPNPDAAIDDYVKNTSAQLNAATAILQKLSAIDPTQILDPAAQADHTSRLQAAQQQVEELNARMQQYQGAQDERMSKLMGRPFGNAPAKPKIPTPEQTIRAQQEPDYRRYLQESGYQVQPPSSRAMRGPMYGGQPLKVPPR